MALDVLASSSFIGPIEASSHGEPSREQIGDLLALELELSVSPYETFTHVRDQIIAFIIIIVLLPLFYIKKNSHSRLCITVISPW